MKNSKYLSLIFILSFFICLSLEAQTWNIISVVMASDTSASSYSGSVVAINGNYAVIKDEGAIYVFFRNLSDVTWIQRQKFSITSTSDYGNDSISILGNYIAAIVRSSTSNGSIYLFKQYLLTDVWRQQQILTPSDGSGFSGSISMLGNYLVAGAMGKNETANGSNTIKAAGASYVFELFGEQWNDQQELFAAIRSVSFYFGRSVIIVENKIIIGASRSYITRSNLNVGYAYAFMRDTDIDLWSSTQCVFTSATSKLSSNQASLAVNSQSNSFLYTTDIVPLIFMATENTPSKESSAKITIIKNGVSNQYLIVTQAANSVMTNYLIADNNDELIIYPNPISNNFRIRVTNDKATLSIPNGGVQLLYMRSITNEETISTSFLPQEGAFENQSYYDKT